MQLSPLVTQLKLKSFEVASTEPLCPSRDVLRRRRCGQLLPDIPAMGVPARSTSEADRVPVSLQPFDYEALLGEPHAVECGRDGTAVPRRR